VADHQRGPHVKCSTIAAVRRRDRNSLPVKRRRTDV